MLSRHCEERSDEAIQARREPDVLWIASPRVPKPRGSNDGASMAAGRSSLGRNWSGRRESNPRMKLGKLPFYH
jgi:hypothetical protein